MVFIFKNHGRTTEKASYFFYHVHLGVIELWALKKKKEIPASMVEMIWAKKKKKEKKLERNDVWVIYWKVEWIV